MSTPTITADVTAWIQDTMVPDVAAYALVLTPGARWHVAPEKLMDNALGLSRLIAKIKEWDLNLWQAKQFEHISTQRPLSLTEVSAWDDTLETIEKLEELAHAFWLALVLR
jgi:hypothetical protein